MTRVSVMAVALGAALAAGSVAHAQAPIQQGQMQNVSDADKSFLQDQAQGTAYEMAIAQLAVQKAERPAVKSYAQMVITDHSQLDAQLKMVARIKKVDLPTDMTAKQKTDLARLQGLSGAAFDKAYEEETTRINGQDKTQDAKQLAETKDETVKQFVQQLQAADQKHFTAGEQLKQGS